MNLNRREMLKLGAGSAAACAVGAFSAEAFAEPKKDKIPIGLQLYSVRRQCAEDLPAVLKAVSAMGYEGVEFAGYYDRTAKEMKKLLDDNGLKCCGTHLRAKIATAGQGKFDEFDAEVEYNQVTPTESPSCFLMEFDRFRIWVPRDVTIDEWSILLQASQLGNFPATVASRSSSSGPERLYWSVGPHPVKNAHSPSCRLTAPPDTEKPAAFVAGLSCISACR